MNKKNTKLSEKEKLFCVLYRETNQPKEAAARAGYLVSPEKTAYKLLKQGRIQKEIKRLEKEEVKQRENDVYTGLKRIAFAPVSDAVKLALSGGGVSFVEIDGMDLFCISEIKVPKTGGMEIKFFDRIKALEKLNDCINSQYEDGAEPFYKALENSAKSVCGDE